MVFLHAFEFRLHESPCVTSQNVEILSCYEIRTLSDHGKRLSHNLGLPCKASNSDGSGCLTK
jgi:hypothetical protein